MAEEGDDGLGRSPNLLVNADFSQAWPRQWKPNAWVYDDNLFLYDPGARGDDMVGIAVPAEAPNDAAWLQTAALESDSTYRLSARIKTRKVTHTSEPGGIDAGANLSLFSWDGSSGLIDQKSTPLFGTNGWTHRELIFHSGSHTAAIVALRVGFFAGTCTGTAWFKDVRLVKVG